MVGSDGGIDSDSLPKIDVTVLWCDRIRTCGTRGVEGQQIQQCKIDEYFSIILIFCPLIYAIRKDQVKCIKNRVHLPNHSSTGGDIMLIIKTDNAQQVSTEKIEGKLVSPGLRGD